MVDIFGLAAKPKTWAGLTQNQILAVAPRVLQSPTIANKMCVFESLLNVEQLPIYAILNAEKVLQQLRHVEWLWKTPLLEPIIPSFNIGGVDYLLPKARFEKLNIMEWSAANNAFDAMSATGNFTGSKPQTAQINNLILSLCRPSKHDLDETAVDYQGDPREKFNPELIESRLPLIQQLSENQKAYFLLYFVSCKKHIATQFKVLFKQENTEGVKKLDFGWIGVMMDLAKEGVFGNFEQTQFTPLYTILYYRAKCHYDSEELKQEMK